MRKTVMTALQVGVIALAALMLSYPEWRTGPIKFTLIFMLSVFSTSSIWDLHKAGILRMSPWQIYEATERPKTSLVEFLAMLAGVTVILFIGR